MFRNPLLMLVSQGERETILKIAVYILYYGHLDSFFGLCKGKPHERGW